MSVAARSDLKCDKIRMNLREFELDKSERKSSQVRAISGQI